jgi:prevent-host-death family protein
MKGSSISIRTARENLAEYINRVTYAHERIALERRGKKVAVLVSVEDAEFLEKLEDEIDVEMAKKSLKEKGRIPYDQVRKDLGLE